MENFKSYPFQKFLDAHTRLNNYIKISTAAVDFLYKSTGDMQELSNRINELILESGERWTPRAIKNPVLELKQLKNDLSKTGIIWVYSSFDVFYKQVEGILSSHFIKPVEFEGVDIEDDEKKESKIVNLYNKLGWSMDRIEGVMPVLKFYEVLRHCVAHNMGLPNEKLISISESNEFITSINKWETKYEKKTISAPPIVTNENIELRPHHSIMYSETCLRIATDINSRIFDKLGLNHFVGITIKSHLTDSKKLTEPCCSSYSRYIAYHLKKDFHISIPQYDEIYNYYTDKEKNEKDKDKGKYFTLKNSKQ